MSLLETKIENNIDLMTRADLYCKCLKTDVNLFTLLLLYHAVWGKPFGAVFITVTKYTIKKQH